MREELFLRPPIAYIELRPHARAGKGCVVATSNQARSSSHDGVSKVGVSTFATAVRSRRQQLRLRQDEVADLAGVSERFVYALENGKQSVQLDKVAAVLFALGLHLELHRGGGTEIRLSADLTRPMI